MNLKKMIYFIIGCLGVAMGVVGVILPLLPAFPFLLIATICFGKSSEKAHTWFIGTKLYKENLEPFLQGKGMTMKTKIRIMITVTLFMSVGFIMMGRIPYGRALLTGIWVFHILYFIFKIKTIKETA